jgi:hypothetical protein
MGEVSLSDHKDRARELAEHFLMAIRAPSRADCHILTAPIFDAQMRGVFASGLFFIQCWLWQ